MEVQPRFSIRRSTRRYHARRLLLLLLRSFYGNAMMGNAHERSAILAKRIGVFKLQAHECPK